MYAESLVSVARPAGLTGPVTPGQKPFVIQRRLHTMLNEAEPRVPLEGRVRVCKRVWLGVSWRLLWFFTECNMLRESAACPLCHDTGRLKVITTKKKSQNRKKG